MLTEMLPMYDNVLIKVARFDPEESPIGVVHILHGFGEHIDLYNELASRFTENHFACIIHDQRGHGEMPDLSPWNRLLGLGVTRDYQDFLEDIDTIHAKIKEWYPQVPVYLYGHSMGGNIALSYLLHRSQNKHHKVILEAPWIQLFWQNELCLWQYALRAWVRMVGNISYKIVYPTMTYLDTVSRDKDYIAKLKKDKLFHNYLSYRLTTQIMDMGEYALSKAAELSIPVLLLCAGRDLVVCPYTIREFSAKANNNVCLAEYPDSYHSMHNDLNKNEVFDRVLAFLTSDLL